MTKNKKGTKIAIIGGSGLDDPRIMAGAKEIEVETPFGRPAAALVIGEIGGREVAVLARHGKDHSIMPTKVPFQANVWALKKIGCSHILATTACGSLKEEIKPKDLVFPDQFIDFTKRRRLTFYEDKVVHTSMAEPFCPDLRRLLAETAKDLALSYHDKGTVITIEGPRFSTRAESRLFRGFGADIVNMSTVPEVILANEVGLRYAAIAMATDYDAWKEGEEAVTWEMILKRMKANAAKVKKLLLAVIPKI
ncbi:MAG: S-methyl-5'-thioadenosine phosphorylase [Candidatus Portnoybacteria bacterium CG_4_9_14_3_um_filter_43_11]|uniref:Purine nucleoside phosphorylase n=1 Tax=Candidatus Portnoybacteria bacterium CG_4_9_14_3_um_filter_43_11 TaxID=1974805 RepID=A0A2M7YLC6_9BACT|nr:MAG: S-methyl-5'-thioadenosine phosphorylase [Candidatus Portnoybacteria bacterium CG_4_9_14_3_um_filter_43_11]